MLKLFRYLRGRYWGLFAGSAAIIVLQVLLDLKIPGYMATITKLVETDGSRMSQIYAAGGMMLLCALGSVAAAIGAGYLSSRFAAALSMSLRSKVFDRVEDFSMEEMDSFSTASLITRSTNDITQIQNFVARGLQQIIRAPIMAGIALYLISSRYWQWTALTGGLVLFAVMIIVCVVSYARPRFQKMQTMTDDLNRVTRENMTGIRVIRAYNAEEYQEGRFTAANDRLTRNSLEAHRTMSIMEPMTNFINNVLTIGIYGIGAFLLAAAAGTERLGIFTDMVVFSSYAAKIVQAIMTLRMILMVLPRAQVSAKRLNEVLDTVPNIADGDRTLGEAGHTDEVEFRHVSFRYPGSRDDVLHDISFTARKGETVAFIGATGSGKSTLVNLLVRFYDATEGTVLVDGRDVREYLQSALHQKLGYAPQKAVLFAGTVRSNVCYGADGGDGNDTDVRHALDIAMASEFVDRLDGGLDADVSRGGTNLSGGQKQRLSIARAVMKKPEIYIFDDTFSALDYKTDRTLRSALKRETAGVTTLIVAQRIGTIRDADKIIVLEDGRIAGIGTHEELLRECGIYQEIARTQLSEEELAHTVQTADRRLAHGEE